MRRFFPSAVCGWQVIGEAFLAESMRMFLELRFACAKPCLVCVDSLDGRIGGNIVHGGFAYAKRNLRFNVEML